MKNIEELVVKLEKIAKLNHDEFVYSIEISIRRCKENIDGHIRIRDVPLYMFKCKETCDEHEFVGDSSWKIEDIYISDEEIKGACEDWGYKYE